MDHLTDTWAEGAVASGLSALTLRRSGDTSFEGDSLPMPGGPGVISSASTALDDHFADCVGSVSTANTSSTGRAIVTVRSVRPTAVCLHATGPNAWAALQSL